MRLPPPYWEPSKATTAFEEDGFRLIALSRSHDSRVWQALQSMLETPRPDWLGVGRDVRQPGSYDNFRLACAWRLEHPALWERYQGGMQQVVRDVQILRRQGIRPPRSAPVRTEAAARSLPGSLNADANEAMLLHGTKPEVLLNIISTGMNERFSGGLFGHGTYLAEDVGKNDQYVTRDERMNADASTPVGALHKRLYKHRNAQHPGKVFYLLVCRV